METAWCPNLVGFGIRAARQTLVSAAAAIKLTTTAGENGAGDARETLHQSSVIDCRGGGSSKTQPTKRWKSLFSC